MHTTCIILKQPDVYELCYHESICMQGVAWLLYILIDHDNTLAFACNFTLNISIKVATYMKV